ncbi:hypothetical protein NFC81_11655 [Salinispirillum sp. LH 10-3-1]|uniref:DUF503 domain-containing protein n=1 Tax=Salinispirillum sp. LH 10-3-1 TaxID=2952525 RepID=A0AB38YDE3_9GAMM
MTPTQHPNTSALLIVEFRLRLDGSQTTTERTQRLAPLLRHWGKLPHIAINETSAGLDTERAHCTIVILNNDAGAARKNADDILAWSERNLNAWIEDFQISTQ